MNWELFCAGLTWCVTVLAFFLAWAPLMMLTDGNYTLKERTASLFVSISGVIVCVLGIATITGMGWIQ